MNKTDVESLLRFYQEKGRALPWREDPSPYHVWISEIMLQQTRVEAVKEYYQRFLSNLPTLKDLAESSEDFCLLLWQGLGYYSRVKNLRKAAIKVMCDYDGTIPSDPKELMKLPGIGEYTSKAIASIAFQKPYISVDGNLLRVFSRLNCYDKSIKEERAKREAEAFFLSGIPARPGDYNQALMNLGELICLPNGQPLCQECPLQRSCQSYQNGTVLKFPINEKKTSKKTIDKTVYLIIYQNKILLEKRPENGLLASLYQLPNEDKIIEEKTLNTHLKDKGYSVNSTSYLGNFSHVFTHLVWNMNCYEIQIDKKPDGLLVSLEDLKNYSIPTAFMKIIKKYLKEKKQ